MVPTREELERKATNDPTVFQVLKMERMGHFTYEQALRLAVSALMDEKKSLVDMITKRMLNEPVTIQIPLPERSEPCQPTE